VTQFLQLRSANSGAPFLGTNQGDTVLWDTTAHAWYVGAGGGGGNVSSVFGRIGAVVAATGDYDGDQVDNVSTVPGVSLSDALDYLLANAGAVASVFGRVGVVVAATGDYDSDQVDNVSGVAGSSVSDALDTLAAAAGVASVFGRTGIVAAAAGDYDASQVDNDAGGAVPGTTVAAALTALSGPVSAKSGAAMTFAIGDAMGYVRCSHPTACTIAVPLNATVPFPIGTLEVVVQAGAGALTIIKEDPSIVLNFPPSLTLAFDEQFSIVMLKKVGTDEWDVTGDLA